MLLGIWRYSWNSMVELDFAGDELDDAAVVGVEDHAAAAGDVAGDVAEVIVGDGDDDLHDGFEEDSAGLLGGFEDGEAAGLFEGDL